MAGLWSGGAKNCEEHFIEEMVLGVREGAGGGGTRLDLHFFLDFRLKAPYI